MLVPTVCVNIFPANVKWLSLRRMFSSSILSCLGHSFRYGDQMVSWRALSVASMSSLIPCLYTWRLRQMWLGCSLLLVSWFWSRGWSQGCLLCILFVFALWAGGSSRSVCRCVYVGELHHVIIGLLGTSRPLRLFFWGGGGEVFCFFFFLFVCFLFIFFYFFVVESLWILGSRVCQSCVVIPFAPGACWWFCLCSLHVSYNSHDVFFYFLDIWMPSCISPSPSLL